MAELKNLKIFHYDDGKGEWQSHRIYIANLSCDDDKCPDILEIPSGYGETIEEAKEIFYNNLKEYYNKLGEAIKSFSNLDVVKVDCCGKPV